MPPDAFLTVRGLGKCYTLRRRLFRPAQAYWAVRDFDLELEKGGTLALVGPSGCGKSTVARAIALFDPPTTGSIQLGGADLWRAPRRERARLRAQIQLIFQQPAATLNPRFTAEEIVSEPLVIQDIGDPAARRRRAAEVMELTGLSPRAARRRALEFSGGERQRLAIARALALEPRLLILDESLTGLDLSIQAQIAQLLRELNERLGLAYILISHDPALVAHLAGRVVRMEARA